MKIIEIVLVDVFIQYTKLHGSVLIMSEDIKNFVTPLLLWFHTPLIYFLSTQLVQG